MLDWVTQKTEQVTELSECVCERRGSERKIESENKLCTVGEIQTDRNTLDHPYSVWGPRALKIRNNRFFFLIGMLLQTFFILLNIKWQKQYLTSYRYDRRVMFYVNNRTSLVHMHHMTSCHWHQVVLKSQCIQLWVLNENLIYDLW